MSYLDDFFSPGGVFSRHYNAYQQRVSQVRLAKSVDWSINGGYNLLGEALTGSGKSMAYGIPAAVHAVMNGRRAIVVTANIALQEQLLKKDLPLIQKMVRSWAEERGLPPRKVLKDTGRTGIDGEPVFEEIERPPGHFSFSMLKGISNYLCLEKHGTVAAQLGGLAYTGADHKDSERLAEWAKTTRTGDRSELDFEPAYTAWQQFSSTSDECKGSKCGNFGPCFGQKARRRSREADIIVCNYHLLFAHIAVRRESGKEVVLPEFDVLILDEAHRASDIARDFFGFRLTFRSIQWLGRNLLDVKAQPLKQRLEDVGRRFFKDLEMYRTSSKYSVRIRKPNSIPSPSDLMRTIDEVAEAYQNWIDTRRGNPINVDVTLTKKRCGVVQAQITEAANQEDANMVYYLEQGTKGMAVLRSTMIDVSGMLRNELFESAKSVTMTSATLSVSGGFGHVVKDTGVPQPKTLKTDSPFDHSRVLLITPPMPDPNAMDFGDESARVVAESIRLAKGRTLGLFTSFKNLNRAADEAAGTGYRIMLQGDAPRTTLLEWFRDDTNSVLLGTSSFWAGVDVPGESLSCLIIDKLPFPHRDDPVLDVISERDPRGWFMNYSMPRAVIEFKQGFGRLIRSVHDVGVVVVLDNRLHKKRYGSMFLRSLPRTEMSRNLSDIRTWLDRFDKMRAA